MQRKVSVGSSCGPTAYEKVRTHVEIRLVDSAELGRELARSAHRVSSRPPRLRLGGRLRSKQRRGGLRLRFGRLGLLPPLWGVKVPLERTAIGLEPTRYELAR